MRRAETIRVGTLDTQYHSDVLELHEPTLAFSGYSGMMDRFLLGAVSSVGRAPHF